MAGVIGFFAALPDLIKLINSIWTYVNRVSGNDPAGYLIRLGDAFGKLNEAKTEEDYYASAKALADLIAGAPAK